MLFVYNNRIVRDGAGRTFFRPLQAGLRWSDPATHGGTLPAPGEHVTVPVGETWLFDMDYTAGTALGAITINGTLHTDQTKDNALYALGVLINDGGRWDCGTEASPYQHRFIVELSGTRPDGAISGPSHDTSNVALNNPNDAFLGTAGLARGIVNMGEWEFRCLTPTLTRTQLAGTASAGASSFTLKDAVTWDDGADVLLAPTGFYDNQHVELLTLNGAISNSTTMATDQTLAVVRNGTLQHLTDSGVSSSAGTFSTMRANASQRSSFDQRAKVALLNRGITIRAPNDAQWTALRYGVHTMSMNPDGMQVLVGVEFVRCGQGGLLGRYPIHLHMLSWAQATGADLGAVDSARFLVRNCVVRQSTNRAFTIHGTKGSVWEDNVAHDCFGHSLFLEDGAEEDNIIVGNWCSGARDPEASATNPAEAITVTTGTPGTFNRTAHGYPNGLCGRVSGSTQPTGVNSTINHYVVNATANTFQLATTPGGSPINVSTTGSNVVFTKKWRIKLHDATPSGGWITNANNEIRLNSFFDNAGRGVWNAFSYPKKVRSGVAISNASPAVCTWSAHGHAAGTPLIVTTTGALPTGLTNHQVVYVSATGLNADDFQVSATPGGASINTSSAGSGTHTMSTGGCFGASALVPLQPFFTPPKMDGSTPLYSDNEAHSNNDFNAMLNEAAIDEQGTTRDSSAPAGAAHGNGPSFRSPPDISGSVTGVLGQFDRFYLWKGQIGAYQNRVENPHYSVWVVADCLGIGLQGATLEGRGAKVTGIVGIRASLNTESAPAGRPSSANLFASYHSALDFIDVSAFGFSGNDTPHIATPASFNGSYMLFGGGVMLTNDFYQRPVEMGVGRHSNWKLHDSVAFFRTPPAHIINDLWDTWTGNQAQDTNGVNRRWSLAGALYDSQNITGKGAGTYHIFDHPFLTTDITSTAWTPAHMMARHTTHKFYGVRLAGDDLYTTQEYVIEAKDFIRLDASLNPIAGASWNIPTSVGSTFFGPLQQHAAMPRGSIVRIRVPERGVQSSYLRYKVYNVSRKAGVDGQTEDDFFYLEVQWSGAVAPRVFASVGLNGANDYNEDWPAIGRAAEYTSVASWAALQSSAGLAYWRDTANDLIMVKLASHSHNWSGWGTSSIENDPRTWDLVVKPAP